MKKLVAIKNGIKLTKLQQESVRRAFTSLIQLLNTENKKIELEYFISNNNSVKVILSEIIQGVKFETLTKFVGPNGGLK